MALPRSIEDSNKQMRTAAIERLRSEHGLVLDKKRRGPEGIADAIRLVEPSLQSDDPMILIRAWVALKPSEAVPGKLVFGSGRPYRLDPQMRSALARLQGMRMPTPVSMSSKVLYSPEFA